MPTRKSRSRNDSPVEVSRRISFGKAADSRGKNASIATYGNEDIKSDDSLATKLQRKKRPLVEPVTSNAEPSLLPRSENCRSTSDEMPKKRKKQAIKSGTSFTTTDLTGEEAAKVKAFKSLTNNNEKVEVLSEYFASDSSLVDSGGCEKQHRALTNENLPSKALIEEKSIVANRTKKSSARVQKKVKDVEILIAEKGRHNNKEVKKNGLSAVCRDSQQDLPHAVSSTQKRIKLGSQCQSSPRKFADAVSSPMKSVDAEVTSSSESEWEEVEELSAPSDLIQTQPVSSAQVQEKTVSISLPGPILLNRKKKKSDTSDAQEAFRQIINRYRKRSQENMHKTHLLFLLSHGQWRNRLCSDELLMCVVLSVIPAKYCDVPSDSWTLSLLTDYVKWFQQTFIIDSNEQTPHEDMSRSLQVSVTSSKVANEHEHALLFVTSCRAMRLSVRLVYSLQPVSFKPCDLIPKNTKLTSAADQGANLSINQKDSGVTLAQASSEERRKLKKLSAKDLQKWHMLQRKEKKGVGFMIKKESEPDSENNASNCSQKMIVVEQVGDSSKNSDLTVQEYANELNVDLEKKVKTDILSAVENSSTRSVKREKVTKKVKSTKTEMKSDKTVADSRSNGRRRNKKGNHVESSDNGRNIRKELIPELPVTDVKNIKNEEEGDVLDEPSEAGDVSTPKKNRLTKKNVKNHNTNEKSEKSGASSNRSRRSCSKRVSYVESSDSDNSVKKEVSSKLPLRKGRVPKCASKSNVLPKTKVASKRRKKSSSDDDFVLTSESEESISESEEPVESENFNDTDNEDKSPISSNKKPVAAPISVRPAAAAQRVTRPAASPQSVARPAATAQIVVTAASAVKKRSVGKNVRPESDDDFDVSETSFRKSSAVKGGKSEVKAASQKRRSSQPFLLPASSPTCDWWAEVYLGSESRWICVNSIHSIVDNAEHIECAATQPLSFVVGYNDDETIKDVTKKYASNWSSSSWKLREDESWWQEVLLPYQPTLSSKDENEDQHIEDELTNKPMPTTIGEFKNHSLYALQRHLLKFEAIYPPSALPLGFIRGEPIYARECVQTLHAREKWIQEGRAVREDEEPYKVVKARPKWNKSKEFNDALKLPLFGHWQTDPYVAPPAVDGKVPVNQYGNVDLYKPWMLPAGTVHLRDYPALNRVARKLDIDCRPAMTGWDFHGSCNHPVFEGWVVCEEHVDQLVAAWEEDQAIALQREHEKRQMQVWDNWKRLIKGLLIIQRLKKRYQKEDNEEEPLPPTKEKQMKGKKKTSNVKLGVARNPRIKEEAPQKQETLETESEEEVVKPELSWPQNRRKSLRTKAEERHNLFPFEKVDS